MKSFIIGTVFGIVISTVGFTGIARMLDNGVERTKSIAIEQAK